MLRMLLQAGLLGLSFAPAPYASADEPGSGARAFNQLEQMLPTPNVYRNAAGAPGPRYWQQEADYTIDVRLDEAARRITASEQIHYVNHSPDALDYLWVQLDQNRFAEGSLARLSQTAGSGEEDRLSYGALAREQAFADTEYGFQINAVRDAEGQDLRYTIVDTMMRIDLPEPLAPDAAVDFSIDWAFTIIEESVIGGRGGYEHFEETDTYLYFLAQWFPRMAAYTDYAGWQHKAFLGRGEFTLEFGDYEVAITVPEDHIVSATGVLQNPDEVLSGEQRRRLDRARRSDSPIFIVRPEEAKENEKEKASGTKTWRFKAERVRDFAWASSRKFIWDAMIHRQDDEAVPEVLAMSFYPNEAEPIWSQYSTQAVVHTMDVYSRFSFPYPYPTAQSVNTWERGGMEYPMITFNGYRPSEDEASGEVTYSRRIKYGLIGVIIHEIGHIYFPMTVNSDERQWTWMDEGINTFLEYMAEMEWEEEFPAFGGRANIMDTIPDYMVSTNQVPIMTQSDSILQFGPNAYSKPAAGLTFLRETIMGRELFDFAFKTYATRWKFKRPTPADFFRTMEDASGVDLDWFWRAWFYTTDHVDVAITDVREYKISSQDPEVEQPLARERDEERFPKPITQTRNEEDGIPYRVTAHPELYDFYNENDRFTVTNKQRNEYQAMLDKLEPWERRVLERALEEDQFVYFADFANEGGVPAPLPLVLTFQDGNEEEMMIPAEIWRYNNEEVTKLLITEKPLDHLELDVLHQLPDADRSNNRFPQTISQSRLELYKRESRDRDLMAEMLVELKRQDKDAPAGDKDVPLEPSDQ